VANYTDPVQMVCDIRAHVVVEGHRVEPVVDVGWGHENWVALSLGRRFGYTCSLCEVYWMVGEVALRDYDSSTLGSWPLGGVLQDPGVRDQLTAYLNGWGAFAPKANGDPSGASVFFLESLLQVAPKVPVVRVSRYKRTPVI
jgi:hypothetical protein